MLTKPTHNPAEGLDDLLEGTCGTCHSSVILARFQAEPPTAGNSLGKDQGAWPDLWSTACAVCRARVFLTRRPL